MNQSENRCTREGNSPNRLWPDWALWSYLATLIRVTRWKPALAVALMIGLGLTEGVGLLMLVPLLQLVGLDVQQGPLDGIARFLSSIFAAAGMRPTLITVLGVYVIIVAAHGLLFRWQAALNLSLPHELVACLRRRLYRAITNANWLFLSRSRSSDFTHVLTAEVERVGAATYLLLQMFATTLVAIAYILFALKLSAAMTGLAFGCGCILILLLKGKTQVARTSGAKLSQAMKGLYAAITEHLGGMKTAKSHGAENRHASLFAGLTEQVQQTHITAVRGQAEVKYWFDVGTVLLLSVILYVSLEVLALPVAAVLLLVFLFFRIMPKISSIQQACQSFIHLLPAFVSVMEIQARCEAAAEPTAEKTETVTLRHAIRLERVSLAYETMPVIHGLDLTLHAGETTAIVGPSGAGKTTIADLIIGLIMPDEGRVLVDGMPLGPAEIKSWRDQIGYVAQDTFLFHDTVRANLLWARPGATNESIQEALRLAGAEDFVSRLPGGWETILGDRGVRLSAGERQRLALARALLRRPALLILDEATNNLDFENENRLLRAIEELHGRMTVLLITHRLSAIRGADVIYVLEKGRLVESGDWDDLMADETGYLRALWKAQGTNGANAGLNSIVSTDEVARA